MTTLPRSIAALDVPVADVEQELAEQAARRIASGVAAEFRHLLYDADPDATTRPFTEFHHHTSTRRRTS
ncbi:hypothetical protein [Streptomyces sp. NPDC005780]|uniref:hypothetical protein n=1 Tax=Streptomyces sp. NPDC005780 TaxID=3364730 RepID=UPI00368C2BCC